jgi:hypothetical protein
MSRSLCRLGWSVLALALLAAPASASIYYVTLNNGSVLESKYQPQDASWDPHMVLLMTDVGNWIGVQKSDIQGVRVDAQSHGYGVVINATTIDLGWAPNDAAVPEAPGQGNPQSQAQSALMQAVERVEQQRQQEQNYSIKQFVEPNQTQGIPSRFVGAPTTTPPPPRMNH